MTAGVLVHRGSVNAWECDERGHMNVQFIAGRSSDAGYAFARLLGVAQGGSAESGIAVLVHHIRYHRELMAGDLIEIRAGVTAIADKTMTVVQTLREPLSGGAAATYTATLGHLDLRARRLRPWPEATRAAAEAHRIAVPPESLPRSLGPESFDAAPSGAKADAAGMAITNLSAVNSWELDTNAHLNVRGYLARFSECQSHMWALAGLPRPEQMRRGLGTGTTEHRIAYLRELGAGEIVEVRTGLAAVGAKTVHFRHWMFLAGGATPVAACEGIAVLFDKTTRKAVPLPAEMRRTG